MRGVGLLVAMALALAAGPALAGGSWLEAYELRYEPGDTVTMTGEVSVGQLGWLEDGPFFAYLRVDPDAAGEAPTDRWPFVHATDLPLGELALTPQPGGSLFAAITFTIPADLEPGVYEVVYCNDPCTDGVGDLIGGFVAVGVDNLVEQAAAAGKDEPMRDPAAKVRSSPAGGVLWWIAPLVLAVMVAVRFRPRPVPDEPEPSRELTPV